MAIAFRTAQSNINIGGSPVQESFTTASGDTHLIVGASNRGTGTVDSVTFNGDAMTSIGSVNQSGHRLYLFSLVNPDVGTYNITFTLGGGATNIAYAAAVYTGAPAGLNLQSFASNSTASGASLTTSNTSPTGWTVLVSGAIKSGGTTLAASTGSTSRSLTNSGDYGIGIFDSNAEVSGAQSMAVTATAASSITGLIATLANTVIDIQDTNVTTDTITGTGNVWFFTQTDTNVTTDVSRESFKFANKEKSAPSTWTTKEKTE